MALRDATRPADDAHRSYQTGDPHAAVGGANEYSWGTEDTDWTTLFDGKGPARVRVSATAAAGALVSVVGLYTVLTGLLAGAGLVIATIGLVLSLAGLVTANRPARTGSGLAGLGIACGMAAIVLAVAALTGTSSWLNSNSDEIVRLHTWLGGHWALLRHKF